MLNAKLVRNSVCILLLSTATVKEMNANEVAPSPSPSWAIGAAPGARIRSDMTAVVPEPPMLAEIAGWISRTFDIPMSASLPDVAIVSPERFAAVIYRRLAEGQQVGATPELKGHLSSNRIGDIVAFYENASQTIFLREGWTGSTPADVSVLVHEMAHHLQNAAGMKYVCPAAREKLAYTAQQEWLALAGRDFFEEFDTDPLTLLVRTSCGL